MSRITVVTAGLLLAVCAAPLLMPTAVPAQGRPAVVEGTPQLFIRRGPGTEFPPFATLTGGSQVQVQELHGQWARVTTVSGQVGYVHVKFLRMIEQEEPPPLAATPSRPVGREEMDSVRSAGTSVRRTEGVSEPFAPTTPQPAATASPTPAAPAAGLAPHAGGENVEVEIRRLADAVEALGRRFDQRLPIPENTGGMPAGEPTSSVSGGAILLGLAGVLIGWVLGATYQRNKERGRRSRIRL